VKGAAQYYKGTDQEKYARMIRAFLGGGGAGLATAAHAGLPNGVRGALYSSLFRGAMKAKTAEGHDAQRRSEREAH
jgi:hypothetical protein